MIALGLTDFLCQEQGELTNDADTTLFLAKEICIRVENGTCTFDRHLAARIFLLRIF